LFLSLLSPFAFVNVAAAGVVVVDGVVGAEAAPSLVAGVVEEKDGENDRWLCIDRVL
jgi:hypothetical protein